MVCLIHRPEYYNILKDAYGRSLKGTAEIIIAKHRNGKTGDVRLKFVGEYARFANLDDMDSSPEGGVIQSRMNDAPQLPADDPLGAGMIEDTLPY